MAYTHFTIFITFVIEIFESFLLTAKNELLTAKPSMTMDVKISIVFVPI